MKQQVKYLISQICPKDGTRNYVTRIYGSLFSKDIYMARIYDHYETAMEDIEKIEYAGFYQIEKVFHLTKEPHEGQ